MGKHEWRERTEEGEVRFFVASRHAAKWSFRCKLKGEDEWTTLDPPPLEDLEYLREILWNKYQRRRVPSEQVAEIDEMIEDARNRQA